jgi:arylsulfatase A
MLRSNCFRARPARGKWILALLLLTSTAFAAEQPDTAKIEAIAEPPPPPNVVIIFCDDLGYSDVGCFGAQGFETPRIDKMARQGRRFTNFYVAQGVCSSSRAALLTGCYPNRIGIVGAL